MVQQHALKWGSFDFVSKTPTAAGYLAQACADGTNFGNPEAEYESIQSLLRDGALTVRGKRKNRTITIRIRFSAPTTVAGPALEAAEKALMLQVGLDQPPPLIRTPAASGAATSYYDVVIAEDPEWDSANGNDLEEVLREYRYFTLTLQCLPFARPKDTVVVPATAVPPPTPTTVNIDTCDATTGWSKSSSGFGPVTKTNLVPNPSFETNATGWVPGSGAPYLNRDNSSPAAVGSWFVYTSTPSSGATSYVNGPTMPVQAGVGYAIVVSTRQATGTTGGILVRFYNAGGGQIGPDLVSSRAITVYGWQGYQVNQTAPAGATSMQIFPFASGAPGTNTIWDLDAAYVTVQQDAHPYYFDGDTTDTSAWIYAWTGTAHASTSTATSTTPATSLSASGGHVDLNGVSSLLHSSTRTLTLTRTGAVAMSTSPYLRVSAAITATGGTASLVFRIGTGTAVAIEPVAVTPSTIAGYSDYYFTTGSFDTLVIEGQAAGGTNTPTVTVSVAHVARTDTVTGLGTNRQVSRTATVGGSAPTQAAIRLFDATPAALGTEVLVHTSRNTAWQPALRPFQITATGVTADTARVSGARNPLGTAKVFRIPAAKFTKGLYSLMALMSVTTSAALTWSVRTVSAAGATTVGSSIVLSGSVTVPVTTGYQILNLAAIPLPVVDVEADQMVELTLTGTANMTLDEAWLFGKDDGVLTWIRDTDSLTWLEIRSPELDAPRPSIFGGTGAKGANSVDVSWKAAGAVAGISYGAFGTHRFEPGPIQIYTVCLGSTAAQSEIEYYERYLSHVAGAAA
jgi:hypothetical protein